MIPIPASLRSDFIHIPGTLIHIALESTIHIVGMRSNRGKSAEPLTSVPETLAAKAQRIKEAEEQLAEYQAIMRDRAQRIEEDAWEVAERLEGQQLDEYNRAYLLSIKRFVETLGAHEVSEAADIALARRPYYPSTRFKYFCGICWKKIRDHGL